MANKQRLSYIYALTAIFFWSTIATAFKIGLKYLDFIQFLFFIAATATVIMFCVLLYQKKLGFLVAISLKELLWSAFLGFLNPFGYYMVLLKAYSILPGQLAQPLNYTWPILLVLLSVPLLNQKLQPQSILALIVSFTGVFLIASKGNLTSFNIEDPLGVLLATGSSIIWALFWIYNVKDKRDEVVKLFLNFLFGSVYIFIAMVIFSEIKFPGYQGFLAAIYCGFFEMGITFLLWMKALQLTSSNAKISNLVFLSPFLSLIFIHFILGEKIFYTTFLGIVFIIAGIIVQQIPIRRQK